MPKGPISKKQQEILDYMKREMTRYISTYYYLLMPMELKKKLNIRADR